MNKKIIESEDSMSLKHDIFLKFLEERIESASSYTTEAAYIVVREAFKQIYLKK